MDGLDQALHHQQYHRGHLHGYWHCLLQPGGDAWMKKVESSLQPILPHPCLILILHVHVPRDDVDDVRRHDVDSSHFRPFHQSLLPALRMHVH